MRSKKRKKVREKLEKNKKGLDRADIVRDYRFHLSGADGQKKRCGCGKYRRSRINSPKINAGQGGSTMTAKEAKDFLVQQTAEQAALESISISHVEKRMMYCVENDAASCPDPLELMRNLKPDTIRRSTRLKSQVCYTTLTKG